MEKITEYTFKNGEYSFSILNYGAHVSSICVPDRDGKVENVVLPYPGFKDNPEALLATKASMNFIIGRFANRISGPGFTLNGKTYRFEPDKGDVMCHSGKGNIGARFWDVRKVENGFLCHVKTTEEQDGFPGTMDVWVKYTMTAEGNFTIHYKAICSEDCPLNLTSHIYFNLSGDFRKTILRETALFESDRLARLDDRKVPDGTMLNTCSTCFDFSTPHEVGERIEEAGGYDHPYEVRRDKGHERGFKRFALISDPDSGRVMECFTDLPSFQFYTANTLANAGLGYGNYQGLCLETQFFPNSPNIEGFPSCIVKAGEIFESSTTYSFSTDRMEGDRKWK